MSLTPPCAMLLQGPLGLAVENNHVDTVQALLTGGADIEAKALVGGLGYGCSGYAEGEDYVGG